MNRHTQKKEILVSTDGGAKPDFPFEWEDIYIRYRGKPGRKVHRMGPVLSGLTDVEHCDDKGGDTPEDRQIVKDILVKLRNGETFMEYEDSPTNCAMLYSPEREIDLAECERLLSILLETRGIRNPKFIWPKE